ncbi:mechanosensitive ion channel family protein [Alteromonas pelagimontana]|uniref:Small-conductance mechanosensitive channel n=1 Tax=Alteromonas pelagimontana TaxID=1858656 RepID=A0A6M4MA32_9ALTE|nr:mechanosensitive ion channel family protein [Alteromonas pelagimontana]QJR79530.1 mechanosensitive ion channel family protein [Alteromonas pelagimontana]
MDMALVNLAVQEGAATLSTDINSISTSAFIMWQNFLAKLPSIGLGAALFLITILLAGPVARLVLSPFNYLTKSDLIRSVSRRAVSMFVILLGCYLFLKLAGLTEFAVAIISGTGVVGLILGFAFRDIAENFISSLLLTVQRPFSLGDVVEINAFTGVVQKVTARATTLVDFDGNHIQIPNASIYKGVIKNLTANPKMRGNFSIGIGYDTDAKQAQQLAVGLLTSHPHVLNDPEPQVLVDNLGSATINLKIYFWIDVEATSVLKMGSVLMRKMVVLFNSHNISMPDDAREVIFPQGINVHTQASNEANIAAPEQLEGNVVVAKESRISAAKLAHREHHEDVSSENDNIRKQATQARDPETGGNIL